MLKDLELERNNS